VTSSSGVVPAGESMDIEVIFNASHMEGGNYDGIIAISNNDPLNPALNIPAQLEVIDAPSIFPEHDTLYFGEVYIGYPDTIQLMVENNGSMDLLIFDAEIQPDEYDVFPPYAGIDPGEFETFTITFSPEEVGCYPGTLTFNNNDPLLNEYIVHLSGTGAEPPVISTSTDSLWYALMPGDTGSHILTVFNTGGSNLEYSIYPGVGGQNYALEFDGENTYINCGNDNSLNIENSITIEAWIYAYDWNGNRRILQKGYNDNQYRLEAENNMFHMELDGLSEESIECQLPPTQQWIHVAGVYNQSQSYMALYFDGIQQEIVTNVSGNIEVTNDPLNIATKNPSAPPGDFFYGTIDEVRLWNIARSQAEIQDNMNCELMGTESGLTGYWKFNEGGGFIAYDATSNGNNGTLENGVLWTNESSPVSPHWLSAYPDTNVCLPGYSDEIEVHFDASDLDIGEYDATLVIRSNDPVTPNVYVNVQLVVTMNVGQDEPFSTNTDFKVFPNPCSDHGRIQFTSAEAGYVIIELLDIAGIRKKQIVNEIKMPGTHEIKFDLSDLKPGIYFCTLKTNENLQTKKIIKL
jgi:hypothetical protein